MQPTPVIASEREATQLAENHKSAISPSRIRNNHQLGCFAFARNDGDKRITPPNIPRPTAHPHRCERHLAQPALQDAQTRSMRRHLLASAQAPHRAFQQD